MDTLCLKVWQSSVSCLPVRSHHCSGEHDCTVSSACRGMWVACINLWSVNVESSYAKRGHPSLSVGFQCNSKHVYLVANDSIFCQKKRFHYDQRQPYSNCCIAEFTKWIFDYQLSALFALVCKSASMRIGRYVHFCVILLMFTPGYRNILCVLQRYDNQINN